MKKQNQNPKAQKKYYEPPKAKFVSLKLEERLLACAKMVNSTGCGTEMFLNDMS